jgi:hypothetical protein
VTCVLSVALLAVTAISCSSTDSANPPTKSGQIEAALDGLTRGARLPRKPVEDAGDPVHGASFRSTLLANNMVGVKPLDTRENRDCAPAGGSVDAYAVTGDADALWRRMIRRSSDGELTMAETDADGQHTRYLRQFGDDYTTEVALSEGSHGTVLALRTCS